MHDVFQPIQIPVYFHRHYRYEQKLACLLWKVDMKEVTLIATENVESSIRTKSLVSSLFDTSKQINNHYNFFLKIQTCRHSLLTEGDTTKRAYTSIGKRTLLGQIYLP